MLHDVQSERLRSTPWLWKAVFPVAVGYIVPVRMLRMISRRNIRGWFDLPMSRGANELDCDQASEDAYSRTGESNQPPYEVFNERKNGNDW